MSKPEEHVRCIVLAIQGGKRATWCGKVAHPFDFHFLSVDHAALNGRAEGRLVACRACTDAVVKALHNGQQEKS